MSIPARGLSNRLFAGPKTKTAVCTYNVRGNLGDTRLKLLGATLCTRGYSIIGLTETNRTETGTQVLHPPGPHSERCALYWSGDTHNKKKHTGVALLLSREANNSLV